MLTSTSDLFLLPRSQRDRYEVGETWLENSWSFPSRSSFGVCLGSTDLLGAGVERRKDGGKATVGLRLLRSLDDLACILFALLLHFLISFSLGLSLFQGELASSRGKRNGRAQLSSLPPSFSLPTSTSDGSRLSRPSSPLSPLFSSSCPSSSKDRWTFLLLSGSSHSPSSHPSRRSLHLPPRPFPF